LGEVLKRDDPDPLSLVDKEKFDGGFWDDKREGYRELVSIS
jgi:hypothetical protein